jgi:hypothetical protein
LYVAIGLCQAFDDDSRICHACSDVHPDFS